MISRMPFKLMAAAAAVLAVAAPMTLPASALAQAASDWRTVAPENLLVIDTAKGRVLVEVSPLAAPNHVERIRTLADQGFYDGLKFHRVIADFMVQGGCPHGIGNGGPGYRFEDEANNGLGHERGVLSMANAGPNTNGSQFFITHVATPWLNGKHTVFGKVTEGLDVVDAVRQGDTIKSVKIEGDAEAALAAKADRVAEWNKILAA